MNYYPDMRSLIEAVNNNIEHWESEPILVFGEPVNVGWVVKKDQYNRRAHDGLSLADGISVITNQSTLCDIEYAGDQEREQLLGLSNAGHILFVVIQWLDTGEDLQAIRIISVRYADQREQQRFRLPEDRSYKRKSNMKPDTDTDATIDKDNPPLRDNARLGSWKERFLQHTAQYKTKVAARKQQQQPKQVSTKTEH